METLLIHKDLLHTSLFQAILDMFKKENVKLYSGPNLNKSAGQGLPVAKELKHEYSDLELTLEIVDNVDAAIEHINKYGSSHTESIITKNGVKSENFENFLFFEVLK
jgi:delta-1-pyrroline-5-carboxylate synthetase